MFANPNIAICHAITPQIAPHHPIFRRTEQLTDASRKTREKITNISLKIFKTLFFKIYNPTFNKVHIPDKTLFSKHLPPQNLNTILKHLSHLLPYSHLKQKPPQSTLLDFRNFILHHKSFNKTF